MSLTVGSLSGCVFQGAAARALADLAGAVRAAERARDTVATVETSVQPKAVDFRTLDYQGWKRWAALTLFRGKDGVIRFTDNRAMVSRRTPDGSVDITLYTTAAGDTETVSAEELTGDSDAALPAIFSFGPRKGALVPTLRVRGHAAAIAPHGNQPLAAAVELRVANSQPRVLPLAETLERLGICWKPIGDEAEDEATQAETSQDGTTSAAAAYDDTQLLAADGENDEATWRRARTLYTLGVLQSTDGSRVQAADVAQFLAAAGGNPEAAEAVAHAIAATLAPRSAEAVEHESRSEGTAVAECLRALRGALDAVDAEGAAAVAREARAFRADLGVPASAGARGTFVARTLRALAAEESARQGIASPARRKREPPARSPLRRSPRHATRQTALALTDDSPRSRTIRQLLAQKEAEAAARDGASSPRATGGGQLLDFSDASACGPNAHRSGCDSGGTEGVETERRTRTTLAVEFGELRPGGAESLATADVVRALESELGGSGRVTAALAEAAGRSAGAAVLTLADSAPALRAAAREWREVLARVSAARKAPATQQPPDSCVGSRCGPPARGAGRDGQDPSSRCRRKGRD